MTHIEIEIPLPIPTQHLLHRLHGDPPRTGPLPPSIIQSVIPIRLVTSLPPSHLSGTDPQNLRRLPPSDPFRQRSQDHVLYFHRPLHFGFAIEPHLPSSDEALSLCLAKRTFHLLIQADILC